MENHINLLLCLNLSRIDEHKFKTYQYWSQKHGMLMEETGPVRIGLRIRPIEGGCALFFLPLSLPLF